VARVVTLILLAQVDLVLMDRVAAVVIQELNLVDPVPQGRAIRVDKVV
jgi:hypothetical protein